ncbi:MAG TPA: hypothetical protein VFL64_16345 [Rhizobacter sp.]|nr:hypothetical protein [Rhizobacter sp.]
MRLHRRSKRWLSGWLMVVLLFTQLITSAYACPTIAAAASAMAMQESMPGCDGNMPGAMDPDQPQLCQAHCSQGSQTVQSAPSVDASPVPSMLLAILDWSQAMLAPMHSAARMAPVATGAPPPGSPPLYLSLLVLRN